MTKKRAPKQIKTRGKRLFKITRQNNSSKKSRDIKPNLQTEARNMQTQKISNSNKASKVNQIKKENLFNYYANSISNVFYIYSEESLKKYLMQETNNENLAQIDTEIISKFGISKELRKYAFKYLLEVLKPYNIRGKLYFKTVSLFDSFLIKYSLNHTKAACSQFFLSNKDKIFSKTKLILFVLCCYFIVNQTFNTQNFELKCLEKFDEEGEMGYDKLNELIYTILKVVDCDIDILGVYDFFNLFLFDLNKKLKMIAKENGFIDFFNQSVNIFAIKIEQDISLSNIVPSAKSLGIIMFSLEYAKFMVNKNLQNDNVNFLIENWIKKVKNILINHKPEDVKRVIHWLNDYVNTH